MSLVKKIVSGAVIGGLLLGITVTPIFAYGRQGNEPAQHRGAQQSQKADPATIASRMAQVFDVSANTILQMHNEGMGFQYIRASLVLSKASGKPLQEVAALKTVNNTWKDVALKLGVTREQMRSVHREVMANGLSVHFGFDRQTVTSLTQQGYKGRDIVMAGLLAKRSNKAMQEVIALKAINNSWKDVAAKVGVDEAAFSEDVQSAKQFFKHAGQHRKGKSPNPNR